jgi:SSS family solute:Na+ symporter
MGLARGARRLIPTLLVFAYLAAVFYIGIFAFRRGGGGAEDFFLAGRSLGTAVFLLSLFGTNMTAFTILGASGHAFANGIVTFGLMASSSAIVIPLTLFFFGTKLWALGKRHGFITPVQMMRDRWQCGHTGTFIMAAQTLFLVPYIIISVMGGGSAMAAISGGRVPYWAGGAIVAIVVMSYVFFGGMRGTAWVNTFQTILFLSFGSVTILTIGYGMGGFAPAVEAMLADPRQAGLLTRENVSPWYFFSYMFIPLSSIAFPHMSIFCLTAKRMAAFKKTVVLYPVCIMAVWLPSVFLGATANRATEVPGIQAKLEARAALAAGTQTLSAAGKEALRQKAAGDDVLLLLLEQYAPLWLAGLLGAGIMAAVMASDSQILALSTMVTEDLFAYYGGKERFGEAAQVFTGRAFVVGVTVAAYIVALRAPGAIFDVAVQYAFTGYAAMSPLLWGALYWRRSTKWGALAAAAWAVAAVAGIAIFQAVVTEPGVAVSLWGLPLLERTARGTAVLGMMPVAPATVISLLLLMGVSLATKPPGEAALARYFTDRRGAEPQS